MSYDFVLINRRKKINRRIISISNWKTFILPFEGRTGVTDVDWFWLTRKTNFELHFFQWNQILVEFCLNGIVSVERPLLRITSEKKKRFN